MGFTNSPLVYKTQLSPKHNDRKYPISKITIHHAAGVLSFDNLLNYVATTSRNMSANYVLRQGKLGLVVEEKYRAWTSGNAENDHKAVTIEVGNSSAGGKWPIADEDLSMLIKWCADVCIRNNIPKLYYDGTPNGTLTLHEMFAPTGCPGPYIKERVYYICDETNKLIEANRTGTTTSAQTSLRVAKYDVYNSVWGYKTAADAVQDKNRVRTVKAGTYYVYNSTDTAVNVTVKAGVPGAWISKVQNQQVATLESIARECIAGKWGNGAERTKRLASAGYNATNVQKAVNALLSGAKMPNLTLTTAATTTKTPTKKSISTIAKEVIAGKWGNGATRKKKLEAAGYSYSEVQAMVNKLKKC